MFYLDTSVLVSAFIQEDTSELVLAWIAERLSHKLAISGWTITEFSSALGVKLRSGQIKETDRTRAIAKLDAMIGRSLTTVDIKFVNFQTAASFTAHPQLNLRGGDALHLAIAADYGATIATLDRGLAKAAQVLAVPVELLT